MPETGYTPTWAYIGYLFCIRTPGDGRTDRRTDGRTDSERVSIREKEQEWNQRTRRVAGRLSGVARYRTYRTGPGLMGEYVMCV